MMEKGELMLIDHNFVKAEVRYRRALLKKSYPKSKRVSDTGSRVFQNENRDSDRRRVAA